MSPGKAHETGHPHDGVPPAGTPAAAHPYAASALVDYFSSHRRQWAELYPSERWVLQRIAAESRGLGSVLDVGCAMGGVGHAIAEQKILDSYTGIDISEPLVAAGRRRPRPDLLFELHAGDVTDETVAGARCFDTVLSLSVADWSTKTDEILNACWKRVAPGGRLILSLRLTAAASVLDAGSSFQFIGAEAPDADEEDRAERVPYVVFNLREALGMLCALQPMPARLLAYGYWGLPSATARTPFQRLTFAVLAVSAPAPGAAPTGTLAELHLPADLVTAGDSGQTR